MSAEDTLAFRRQYENILSLLSIRVHYLLIEALIWDRNTACFRFGNFELTPTLEEFFRLLDLPHDRNKLVQPFAPGGKNNLSSLLACSRLELTPGLEGSPSKCSLKFI
jgi:hypothetical protein